MKNENEKSPVKIENRIPPATRNTRGHLITLFQAVSRSLRLSIGPKNDSLRSPASAQFSSVWFRRSAGPQFLLSGSPPTDYKVQCRLSPPISSQPPTHSGKKKTQVEEAKEGGGGTWIGFRLVSELSFFFLVARKSPFEPLFLSNLFLFFCRLCVHFEPNERTESDHRKAKRNRAKSVFG